MSGKKKYFTSYLSKDVAELAKYLTEREEITKVVLFDGQFVLSFLAIITLMID